MTPSRARPTASLQLTCPRYFRFRGCGSAATGSSVAHTRNVDRNQKRLWLGRRVWVLTDDGVKRRGTICSVDHRVFSLAKIMIRLDGRRGAILLDEAGRGVTWDFAEGER